LTILITPPWWGTTWFRALSVLALGLLIWGGLHIRVHQLQQQEKRFREAVETMPALAFVNEPDGGRTFVNRAWLEYTGLSPQQASGSGWEKAIHPEDLNRVLQRWRTAQNAGELLEYEVRVRRGSDGVYRWFQTRARPLYDKRGNIVKWCAVASDIEDRKRAEQLQADLAHVTRVSTMGELAASISHELNQPIAASIMNASLALQFLERNPPDLTQVRDRTTKTIEMGTLASEIIDRLRSLYKKEPPKQESIAVNEVIGEMVELLRGQATRHGVSIRTDLTSPAPSVIADRVQIQQVLMNLMLNGIEAMSDTGGVLTLKSEVLENGQVEISVSDTGPGLPSGNADQIFDAFFTTKPQGSGMGLAISKSIVESHGGRIWASGNDGRGARFLFTLPPAPVNADSGEPLPGSLSASTQGRAS
jgi:PAS domain S-box-containing protein